MQTCSMATFRLATALAMIFSAQSVFAAELNMGTNYDVKLTVGGILASFDASVGLNGTTNNGTPVDLSSGNGNKNAGNVFFGAEWRFLNRNRLSGIYFTTKKKREVTINDTITIGDDTLNPPTTLDAETHNRFLFATYQYSFVKHDDLEIAGLIGLYANKFSVDLSGTANVTTGTGGGATTVTKDVAYNPSTTVPMPLIGASVGWYVTPQVDLRASLSGLKAKIGDVDGSVWVFTTGGEYMFTKNFGAGLSYMHTRVNVDVTKKTFNGSIDWTNNNFLLYAIAKF